MSNVVSDEVFPADKSDRPSRMLLTAMAVLAHMCNSAEALDDLWMYSGVVVVVVGNARECRNSSSNSEISLAGDESLRRRWQNSAWMSMSRRSSNVADCASCANLNLNCASSITTGTDCEWW